MPRIPAYCPNCGSIFPSPVALGGGARVVMENVSTNCPRCGGMARMDGEFFGAEDAIHIIRSSLLTPDRLQAFARMLREAYETEQSLEETKKKAAEIDPALGRAVESLGKGGNRFLRTSLLFLMLSLSQCKYDVKVSLDVNELINQMSRKNPTEITSQIVPIPRPDPRPNKGRV